MKKIFTILTVVALTATISFAQTFGVKAGTSLASWYGADVDSDDKVLKPGMAIGAFAQFGDDTKRLTSELLFIQKGVKYAADGDYMSYNMNYLEANTMGNFFVSDNISLNAGIYLGLHLGSSITVKIDGDKDSESIDSDDDDTRPMDFGSNFGLTFWLNDAMSIDARYGLGILSLDEDGDFEASNSTIQISFGYAFGN
ncbi:MAG: outer membrane beta-barrel protein [Flavobacteriales bacterium]|nr:outer membrane beta-barrel protein [Flavobacteriales bacterium]